MAPNPRCSSEDFRRLVYASGPLSLAAALGRARTAWRDFLVEHGTPLFKDIIYQNRDVVKCLCRNPVLYPVQFCDSSRP